MFDRWAGSWFGGVRRFEQCMVYICHRGWTDGVELEDDISVGGADSSPVPRFDLERNSIERPVPSNSR